jgi:hypothetical protein
MKFEVHVDRFHEGKGYWCELRFTIDITEAIATNRLSDYISRNTLDAFLSVTVSPDDSRFLVLSPVKAVNTTSCHRMLRDYRKSASLKWCFKSKYFGNRSFAIPLPLDLFESNPKTYVGVCSKLI